MVLEFAEWPLRVSSCVYLCACVCARAHTRAGWRLQAGTTGTEQLDAELANCHRGGRQSSWGWVRTSFLARHTCAYLGTSRG